MLDLTTWMEAFLEKVQAQFGPRLAFVGLQGSHGRGEATDSSDIDVVVVLDSLDPEDLKAYSGMLDGLPHRDKACGFISGRRELRSWERSDLFQFYHDTTPLLGDLENLLPPIGREDAHRAIRLGTCNVYHLCAHNMVHGKDPAVLQGLYKSAAFTVQALGFEQTGVYWKRKTELLGSLRPAERAILQTGMDLKENPDLARADFDDLSARLLTWASGVLTASAEEAG